MLTLHIVPNAHIDPAWLWDWREGMNESLATCDAVVKLMEKYPELTFSKGESIIYRHIEEHDPVLFEKIRAFVKDGRWEIAGGAMLQPDTNQGAGEAYVRQYLYGIQYFASRFGIFPEIAYQVDSFGHAAVLPAIYAAAGLKYAVQCRPSSEEMPLESRIFRWVGPDWSEVLAVNLESYGLEHENKDPFFTVEARIKKAIKSMPEGFNDWVLLIGMGDHGGGLSEKLIQDFKEYIDSPPRGWVLKFSSLSNFFSKIECRRNLCPVVKGELQYSFRGCYTSVFSVKKAVREAESLAGRSERLMAVAGIANDFNPSDSIMREIWEDVLFNHFHDILPGSSIERVCEESLDHLGRAKHAARGLENDAALSIFKNIDTRKYPGVPVLIFNPHGTGLNRFIELEWMLDYRPISKGGSFRIAKGAVAISDGGQKQYVQFLRTDMKFEVEWRVRSVFKADMPACGYKVFWLKYLTQEYKPAGSADASIDRKGSALIKNKNLKVFCSKGGRGILIEDDCGKKWLTDAAHLQVLEDFGDSWGKDISSWKNIIGEFYISNIEITENGPLKASIRAEYTFKKSRYIQDISLFDGEEVVRIKARLIWSEKAAFCKMAFPFKVDNPVLRCGGPYSGVERQKDSGEGPFQGWVAVIGKNGEGWGVAGGAGNGFDFYKGCLRMSVVRSVLYGSTLSPDPENKIEDYMDMGTHVFDYVIAPWKYLQVEADLQATPVHTTLGYPHTGRNSSELSIVEIIDKEAVLGTLKRAEDARGWICRIWDRSGVSRSVKIKIMGSQSQTLHLKAGGITTFRIDQNAGQWEVVYEDILESIRGKE